MIYLDHAATTPILPSVRERMEPFMEEVFGNPSSLHSLGRRAAVALADARAKVADSLGVRPSEVLFTRGGTESDNLAILGRIRYVVSQGMEPHLVVSRIEHPAVRETALWLERTGVRVTWLEVSPESGPDSDQLAIVLENPVSLVSVMWVNNETGSLLPPTSISVAAAASGVPFHSDAVQAIGKVPVRPREAGVNLLTLSGHKIGGPKGTGALIVEKGTALEPLILGGGQERGLRPGTEDVAGAVGLAEAVAQAVTNVESAAGYVDGLRCRLEHELSERIADLRVLGAEGPRAPHILSVSIPGVDSETLVVALDLEGLSVSNGSACASGGRKPGYVLPALYGPSGSAEENVGAPLRFSFGAENTEDEVIEAADITGRVVARMRELQVVGGSG